MREVPVDAGAFLENVSSVVGLEPVTDFETKEQSRTKDGVAKWKLQLLYKRPNIRKPDVVEVGFAQHEDMLPDQADVAKGLYFRGLRAMLWEQGGRHGLAMTCDEFSFGPWRNQGPDAGDREPVAA